MKKFLPLFATAALFAACNGKPGTEEFNLKSSAIQPSEKVELPVKAKPKPTKAAKSRTVKYEETPVVIPQAEQPAQKKKWSKRAKGAVIGAGSGAILGAVIVKKNRPLGAVIGGVVGGGVGYGIGRSMDKKDGRL